MFQYGRLYRHRNFVDVCFRVKVSIEENRRHIKMYVDWFLVRSLGLLAETDLVVIERDDIQNYTEIKETR